MKFGRFLILAIAALAGTAIYKVRTYVAQPDDGSGTDRGFLSHVIGSGSLGATYNAANAERKIELEDDSDSEPEGNAPRMFSGLEEKYGHAGGKRSQFGSSPPVKEVIHNDYQLIEAAANGDIQKIEGRLAARVKIDSRDNVRRTPLMYASWNGHKDACERLLAAGANPSLKDRNGNNVFTYAAGRGLVDVVDYLIKRTNTHDDQHYREYAQLMQAVYANDPARMPQGTGKLASVNQVNPEGQTPLLIASANGSVAMIDALIQRGAQVDMPNMNHQTPLQWAAWNNRPEAVELLLKKGADISSADLGGNTPLIMAVENNGAGAARILLSHGADKFISNRQGKNATIIAEDKGNKELKELLK